MRFGQRAHRGKMERRRHFHLPAPPPRAVTNGQEQLLAEDAVFGPSLPTESTIHLVIDLALRIGEVQMASGAGAADCTATIIAVTSAYGLPHCEVDVIFTSITVSCHRGTEAPPISSLRVVRTRGTDYTRLVGVEDLVRKITAGKIRVGDATSELNRLTTAPHPYPRWTATCAWAGMAASISFLIGGDVMVASMAAIITGLVDRVGRLLNRRGLPFFFQQLVGGALATGIAMGIVHSHLFPEQLSPTLMVAAAITVLLSGLSVVSTAQDAISGYHVTAAGRSVEIALTSAGLIAGVVLALNVAVHLGLPSTELASALPSSPGRLPIQLVAGAAAAMFFALASYAGPRVLLVSGVAGAIGALAYGLTTLAHFGQIGSAGAAATVIGFGGGLLARRLRLPPVVVAVSGLTPLLPGYSTYRALFQLSVSHAASGVPSLIIAITIAVALGSGVVLGEFLAQPVRTGLGRLERRFSGPRMAGPLRPARRRLE